MRNFYNKILTLLLTVTFLYAVFSAEAMAEEGILANMKNLEKVEIRQKILLNGTWEAIWGKGLEQSPVQGWKNFQIPGGEYSNGFGESSYIWTRKQIEIPESWENSRIFINFNSCRFNPHIYIDKNLIAERMDGWTPFEVEITSVVKPGTTHWLQLRCQDQTATFADGFRREQNQPYDAIRGKVLAPTGGSSGFFGPFDDVWLFSRPNTYLDDIVIATSTRKNTITVSGSIVGSPVDNLWVEGKVLDKDNTVLEIPASPTAEKRWGISSPFANAEYWSPEDPHLYRLQLTLRKNKNGEVIETLEERFGFKEFWTDGPDFYLNGVKRHLLGSSCWPITEVESYDKIREKLKAVKAANIVAFRYHTEPWPKRWVDIADEVGIMIIDEAAVYTDQVGMYAYNDNRFWKNYRSHLEGLIKRDRNNASVIMWSIENELLFMGMNRYAEDLPQKLGDLGRFVKGLDPSHPITFEGDLDPDGAADVLGLHYPHELPTYSDWPNTADWLSERIQTEASGGMLGMTRRNFYWDRTKPLYIGEYLWTPVEDYSTGTIFFGDKAYTNQELYHNKAKLQAWIDQTIAYRRAGLSGMCPWSCFGFGVVVDDLARPFYETQTNLYRPVEIFLRNRDTRFFSGDMVERTFDVFNDSPSKLNLSLKWELANTQISGEENFTLEPGGSKPVTISFAAPDVEQPTEFEFQSELLENGRQVGSTKEKYIIEEREPITAPAGINVLLYDPDDVFYKKIPIAKRIESFGSLREVNVDNNLLIIAPQVTGKATDKAQIGQAPFSPTGLLQFLKRGGKVVVLEQNTLDGFGLGLLLSEKASTMTFALNKEHPILAGLSEEDLKFWRDDNYVTSHEIVRPTNYGARAITVSGSDKGLDRSPIMEFSVEKGSVLLIQALVGQKLDIEPSARRILQNSINYMAAKKPNDNKTIVFNSDAKFMEALSKLGLNYTEIKGTLNDKELGDADILVLHGGGRKIIRYKNAIEKFLKFYPSKMVYWHCPDPDTFAELKDIMGADNLEIVGSQGPVSIYLRKNKFLSGVSREDLLFLTELPIGWQREINIDPSIIGSALMPKQAEGNQQNFEIEAETLELRGNIVSIEESGDTVAFRSRGTATGLINVPQSGIYMLSLVAGGRENRGIYPSVEIKAAGKIVGRIITSQNEIREYPFLAELPAGINKLEISFVNGSPWGGGVALWLDKLIVGEKVNIPENVELMTLPAALVNITKDKSRVLIDNIKWYSNEQNTLRGERYASALLANLGASFKANREGNITWLDIEDFELVGESPYFEKTATELRFRSNGIAEANFNCAKTSEYTVFARGSSTDVKGRYGLVKVLINNQLVGRKVISSSSSDEFKVGTVKIIKGKHKISVSFVNDLLKDGQDRNLFIEGIGFQEK